MNNSENIQAFCDRRLSLWQSVVGDVAAAKEAKIRGGHRPAGDGLTDRGTFALSLSADAVQAATSLVASLDAGQPLIDAKLGDRGGVANSVEACCKLAFKLAWARVTGDTLGVQKLSDELTGSVCDPMWLEAVAQYVLYFDLKQGDIPYRSGGDYILDVKLPAKARVALLADWGTGTASAVELMRQIAAHRPDLVIHLGDIYYSGTLDEVKNRFLNICRDALGSTPVLALCGNHDVYSGGDGYYWLVDQLGQRASYFCVRNADWQFSAVDSGYNDFDPLNSENVTDLTDVEAAWHLDKLREGKATGRKTVLLSHHPLFSAYEPIGQGSVNQLLLARFKDHLPDVAAWFWGHRHRLSIYAAHLGLRRGRCIGCGAIPEFVSSNYYTASFPEVPLLDDPKRPGFPIMLGDDGVVWNHAYCLLELDGKQAKASYFQNTDETSPIFSEVID